SSIPDVLAVLLYFFGSALLLDRFRYTATIGSGQAVLDAPWLIPLALGVVVFGVAGAGFVIVQKRRSLHALAAVAGVLGAVLLDRNIARQDLPPAVSFACFLAFAVLQALIVWYLANAFGWIAKRGFFTSELVHIHVNWSFLLAAYFVATTLVPSGFYRDAKAVRWGMLGLILSVFTLYALLVTASLLHRSPPRKRLLLLRVFGRLNEREDLLDDLDDTWRRIGTVELLAASDVASRLLELRDLKFLETKAAVDDEIRRRRTRFGADARYPVNAFFCHESVWFYAFTMLAEPSDVVMMDLRGFSTSNAGCVRELDYLLEESKNPLERVVLLVDHDSDLRALDEKAAVAGVAEKLTVLDFGKRPSDERCALFELLLAGATP
ncbi:MAG TPA: hypothetical protein VFV49_08350, partial [Thermoanaerobaculia bacterium]|nr:hypothetical protein [Thermoanaerobaculia bacterium]